MTLLKITITIIFFTAAVFGQGGTGQLSGTVTDPNGAVVAGATVQVKDLNTGFTRGATTDGEGNYSLQLLPAGNYSIEITGQGFQKYRAETTVNIAQTTVIDSQLSISGGENVVNVEAPVAQVESSQNGRTVSGETLRQIPLPTRNFQQLLTLSPGAQSSLSNSTDLGRGDATITVNGQRTTSNSVRINGVDANSIGTNSTPNIAVPATDSIQEFIVQTSMYDAASGRNSGGNIEAITRGGSNVLHGNAYYFLRNKALNANEAFIKARGLERPVATRNQFGGTIGGPVVKDRVFFFGSYQGTRETNGVSLVNSLTSPAVPAGLRDDNRTAAGLAATFGIPVANINPVAVNILNARLAGGAYAIPSSGFASTSTPFAATTVPQSGVSRFRENQFNINGDFVFTDNHNLSAKFFVADNPTFQANYNFAGLGNGDRQLIGFGGDLTIKQKLYSITDTYIFSPNVVNQARFGFNRLRVTSVPEEPFTAASLGITSPLASQFPGAPTIRVLGLDSAFFFGSGTLADQSSRINGYTFGDTLSWTTGKHRLRFGAEYRRSTVKFYFNAFSRGQLLFASFSDFLTGGSLSFATLTNGLSLIGSGEFDRSFRVTDASGFVQDDWRISDRLTVNLGVRYDFYGLPVDTEGRLVNIDPTQLRIGTTASPAAPPNGLVQAEGGRIPGVPTVTKTLVPVDKNNIAPRVGFAYMLDEDLNLVVRGGYGVYYDRISTRYANTQLFNYPYFTLPVSVVSPIAFPGLRTFANPFFPVPPTSAFPLNGNIPTPTGAAVSGVFVDPELQTPYVQQFNIGVQWQLFKNYLLDVGYVGNKGTHLMQVITLNQPTYNSTTNSFFYPLGPSSIISGNKNVTGGIQQVQTTSLSTYHSLQASLTRRFSNGLQFLAAYTFGKSIDYYSGAALNELTNVPGDQYDWRTNRGRSDFNREQRIVISGVYDLPFKFKSGAAKAILGDWQVAGVAVFQTGLPFSIENSNGTGLISRANYNQAFNGDLYTTGSTATRLNGYFNTSAFVPSCPQVVASTSICTGAYTSINNPRFDPNRPFGNSLRNVMTGPGQKNVDISFIKMMPFGERYRGELRAEFFNVFNWVNYANPNNNISGANFGRIERASAGPRVIQLAFKFSF
ncbi:MAG: TonB-dependent receptor [Pyrinomonadaceae bacterium]|nr:TonB-dependent receptor [Pyrinomonadaceae bacterium]MBP6213504.1 TonB-dependent receptor [Pyrinomonadaceae bacterium]